MCLDWPRQAKSQVDQIPVGLEGISGEIAEVLCHCAGLGGIIAHPCTIYQGIFGERCTEIRGIDDLRRLDEDLVVAIPVNHPTLLDYFEDVARSPCTSIVVETLVTTTGDDVLQTHGPPMACAPNGLVI